jgi:hypothetical protein
MGEMNIRMFKMSEEYDNELTNEEVGSMSRTSNDRVKMLQVVKNKYIVAAGARSQEIDIYHLSSPDEAEKKRKKRLNKDATSEKGFILRDLVRQGESYRTSEGKLRSVDAYEEADGLKVLL